MKTTFTALLLASSLSVWASPGADREMADTKEVTAITFEEFTALSDEEIGVLVRAGGIDLCLREGTPSTYLQYWDLMVVDATPGIWFLSGILYSDFLTTPWPVLGTYNKPSATIVLDATNPAPDFCTAFSDFFTNTGNNVGPNFSGTWVNNCGFNGTWTGIGRVGDCPAARLAPGAVAAGGALATRRADLAPEIQVYPNPATTFVRINLEAFAQQSVDVQVFDATGKLVQTLFSGIANQTQLEWNSADVAPGMYLIRTVAGQQVLSTPITVVR
ncbi:MAG: T9SS type A sorting domain-containing protein [Bacteroidetes bacterium]|nr:T9SS type A sorting domain-containing protein [Bacteroidota bacterium]